MLNPGVWRDLFDMVIQDETDGSSSDDQELRDYLNMSHTQKKRKTRADEEHQEDLEEAALLCSEPMFEEHEQID